MNPFDFVGQKSKVMVTIDIYGYKLVNSIETKLLCISISNLVDMLTIVKVTMDIYKNKRVNTIANKPLCA